MTWTNLTFANGDILTSSDMTSMDDNFDAITAGDSGAPKLTNAALNTALTQTQIAAAAVAQADLKSTTANQSSGSVASNGTFEFTPTGGLFTFAGFVGQNTAVTSTEHMRIRCHSSQQANLIRVKNNVGAAKTASLLTRFIQGSPPYNLGNGDIPLFVFLLLDKTTKEILGAELAEDPPWYAYGPHTLGLYGKIEKYIGVWGRNLGSILDDPKERDEVLLKLKKLNDLKIQALKKEPWSQQDKNIDMNIVPHLFNQYDSLKHDVVLVDPCGSIVETLSYMHKAMCLEDMKKESLIGLFENGKIKIKSPLRGVVCPKGVIPLGVEWARSL